MAFLRIICYWIVLLTVIMVSECQWNWGTHPSDLHDAMGRMDKNKITTMVEELLKDCKMKQRQCHAIREQHNFELAYDIGLVMGKIREKYKRMMTIYRMSADRRNNRSTMIPPGIRDYKTLHWIIDMEMVHYLQVDIDKLIHVLETIPNKTLHSLANKGLYGPGPPTGPGPQPASNEGPRKTLRTSNVTDSDEFIGPSRPQLLRTSSNSGVSPNPIFQSENDLKQYYREQYKAKSGHSGNWTLDEYYGVT